MEGGDGGLSPLNPNDRGSNDFALLNDPLTTFQRLFPCHEIFTKFTIISRTLFDTRYLIYLFGIRFVAITVVGFIHLRGACTIFGAQ